MVSLAATLLAIFWCPTGAADDPPQLPPVEARTKATAMVAEVFAAEVAKAKTPLELSRLAGTIRKSAASEKEPATKWAMLDFARGLAAQAGDARLLFETVGELQNDYGAGAEAAI